MTTSNQTRVAASSQRGRQVHVRRGQTLVVKAGAGVEIEIVKLPSGAVTVRNRKTRMLLRAWAPKEARSSR